MSDKEKKAKQHIAAGEKALKTSLFKWKPEYDIAVAEFEKAGLHFKLAKLYKQAADAYVRASECHAQPECSSTPYHVGKALESASTCAREAKDTQRAIDLLHQAALQFRMTGKNAPACSALEKAAKLSEQSGDFKKAHGIWLEVTDLYEEEEKLRQCKRPIENAITAALRANYKKSAAKALERQSKLLDGNANATFVYQSVLSRVVVYISDNDFAAADHAHTEACSDFSGYGSSTEGMLSSRLLQACEDGDEEEFNDIKRNQTFTFLLAEVTLLVRQLTLEGVDTDVIQRKVVDDARTSLFASPASFQPTPPNADALPSPSSSTTTNLKTNSSTSRNEERTQEPKETEKSQLEDQLSKSNDGLPSYTESESHTQTKKKIAQDDGENQEEMEEGEETGGEEEEEEDSDDGC
eukprot:m.15138 g.15138  ORF g.15138 m.15138 type:complete len:410 (-) comp7812_c0_seq1:195-1424(-)